ncbi:hypothetical protein GCM10009122_20290 [Fulvivirga kasyanovii]
MVFSNNKDAVNTDNTCPNIKPAAELLKYPIPTWKKPSVPDLKTITLDKCEYFLNRVLICINISKQPIKNAEAGTKNNQYCISGDCKIDEICTLNIAIIQKSKRQNIAEKQIPTIVSWIESLSFFGK